MANRRTHPRLSRRGAGALGAVLALAVAAVPIATAHEGGHGAEVAAAGNPVTGGLVFEPAEVEVAVGERVRWTNTDVLVPHTATEDHGLWDLAGDYGGTPANPSGFGPGDSVERRFEAGSWSYYCRVHGKVQSGTVKVPVALAARKAGRVKGKPRFAIVARWSRTELAEDQVFDVQIRRRGRGARGSATGGTAAASTAWKNVRNDTRSLALKLKRVRRGTRIQARARVHRAGDPASASGWSPPARIVAG